MQNGSKIATLLVAAATIIGVYSGIIGIANFHCNKTFADDYFRRKKSDTLLKQFYISPTPSALNNPVLINRASDTSTLKGKLLQTEDSTQLADEMGENVNNVDLEVLDIKVPSSKQTASDNEITVSMSEAQPSKGCGKLALRSFCSHCYFSYVYLRLLSSDSILIDNISLQANFNPKYKRAYTYTKNLLPGKYTVELNYRELGKDFIKVDVQEKKVSLYKYHKVNPYGDKNGKVVFFSRSSPRKWKITIDKKVLGILTVYKNKGASVILPSGTHEYLIESTAASELDLDNETISFYLAAGQRMPIYIE
jgi:hypothetical protein